MTTRRALGRGTEALAVGVLLWFGCAYYNTLYNAEVKFEEAEEAQARASASQGGMDDPTAPPTGPNPQAGQYEDVIAKCKKLMAQYPDSKHVDDAMLLSARSLYRLGKYSEAVSAIDSLERRYPKSKLLDDALFVKGKSMVAAQQYELAVPVLKNFTDKYRKHDDRPEGLYLLCISYMRVGLTDEAVQTLATLEKDHGRSEYRFRAQVNMAEILAEQELYDQSLAVYRRLSESRIPEKTRFDVWIGMAGVQEQVGDYAGALATLQKIRTIPPGPSNEPTLILLRARAFAGVDSTTKAVNAYKDVTKRFARGTYAAEAHFHLAELYESMDSLQTAQRNYQEVPRAYSGSEYAEEAIRRSSNIGRVLRLQQTSGDDSPEAIAMRTFSMAEIQFFQFNSVEKAVPNYEKIVTEFPDSEYAPRAVYALGYISGVVQGDTAKAREWYDVLRSKYPTSPQAELAYAFYKGAPLPPPYSELIKTATVVSPAGSQSPAQPRPERAPPPPAQAPPPVPVDTARTEAPPPVPVDTARTEAPPPGTAPVSRDTSTDSN
jgi:TolA-binding protein